MSRVTRVRWMVSGVFGLVAIAVATGLAAEPGEVAATPRHPLAGGGGLAGEIAAEPGTFGFEEIVFVKRKPFSSSHYYTDISDGTRPDRFVPDNGIYVYNLRTRSERTVVKAASMPGGKGVIGKIALSFDAKKILFDFRQDAASGFRIWEVRTDGSGLRQVSFPPPDEAVKAARYRNRWHTDDIHPCYLPDGKIIFSSTRSEHTVLCGGYLVAPSLHRMDADGGHVEQLSNSPVSEFCPLVLADGRVMYHRWEYVDKGSRVGKSVWSMNPDGGSPRELYGLDHDDTTVCMYPQPLPGSNHRFVCVGTCHYPQGGCLGPILLVDYGTAGEARGPDPDEPAYVQGDPRRPMINITPQVFIPRRISQGWRFLKEGRYVDDAEGRSGPLYTHPYPISDREFLVSCKVRPGDHYQNVDNAYVLCLIDVAGRRCLLHADAQLSCWHPLSLAARPVPPVVRPARDPELAAARQAECVLANVYHGMEGVKPGEVKWLRINEALSRYWSSSPRWAPAMDSAGWKAALWPRVQWGIVPVESDGSAHFVVPANRNIFLQALDENFREIQRERTYVNYAPGEVRSCTGCHGHSSHVASARTAALPLALTRRPSVPQPQACDLAANGGTGLAGQVIHYPTDIQPIFNAKCVSCHGAKSPAGGLRLTGEITDFYNTSYEQLARKEMAGPLIAEFTTLDNGDRGNYNGAYLPPRSLGCTKSTMIAILTSPKHPKNAKDDHSKMLTACELMILSRWVDSNYQFYGSYFGRRLPRWISADPANPAYDPGDFRRKATFEEAIGFLAPPWHR